jgi:hypothetical protein
MSSIVTSPGGAAVFVDDDGALDLLALKLFEQFRNALGFRHDHRRTQQPADRAGGVGAGVEREEILHEDEAGDVVEAVLVDGKPRVLLLAKQRAEVADGRGFRQRHDIGARRHDLAHQGVAEVDEVLQQPPLFGLDQAFLFRRVDVRLGRFLRFLGGLVGRRLRRTPARARHRSRQPPADRPQRAGDRRERRQEDLEHSLGIAADDEQRQQHLADHDERGHRDDERGQRVGGLDAHQPRHEHGREAGHDAEQQADRDEQDERVVEVLVERARPAAPLGHQPQRQAHQRAERGVDDAEVHGDAREQKDRQRCHA